MSHHVAGGGKVNGAPCATCAGTAVLIEEVVEPSPAAGWA